MELWEIGKKIRGIREKRGMTQSQLAGQLDIDTGHLSRIERGVRIPSLKLLFRIAELLQIEIKDFF